MKRIRGTGRRRLQDTVETLVFFGFVALLWRAAQGAPWPFLHPEGAREAVAEANARPLRLSFLSSDVLRERGMDASDVFGEPFHPGTLLLPNPLSTIRPPASDTLPPLEELIPLPVPAPEGAAGDAEPSAPPSEP
jgi:hypothetical protein